ncbi:MAG TPA: hypothetical protein VGP70_21620 [Actinomadura sp.]|nr:hypothetical protein [Actinomadura sp.]
MATPIGNALTGQGPRRSRPGTSRSSPPSAGSPPRTATPRYEGSLHSPETRQAVEESRTSAPSRDARTGSRSSSWS